MKPTKKSKEIEEFLETIYGRTTAINNNKCVWCKTDIKTFKDDASVNEYKISGLCQACQDEVFVYE